MWRDHVHDFHVWYVTPKKNMALSVSRRHRTCSASALWRDAPRSVLATTFIPLVAFSSPPSRTVDRSRAARSRLGRSPRSSLRRLRLYTHLQLLALATYTPHRPHPRDRASTLITNQKPSLLKTPPLRREDRRRHGEGDRQRRKHLVVGFELDDRVNGAADGAAPRAALHHRESVGNEPHLGLSTRGGAQQASFLCHTRHRAVASARSEAAGLASSRRARKAVDAAVVQTASATMPPRLSSYAGYTAWGHRGRGQRVHACEGQARV